MNKKYRLSQIRKFLRYASPQIANLQKNYDNSVNSKSTNFFSMPLKSAIFFCRKKHVRSRGFSEVLSCQEKGFANPEIEKKNIWSANSQFATFV